MTDEERAKGIIKIYKQEELESMNYILGKPADNKRFTAFELEGLSKINLFNRNVVNICKMIWDNRDNPEELDRFQQILKKEGKNGDTSIINSEKVVAENQQV